ncbi:hypothetical protein LPJ73_006373 [Coemansia sp. RSA 2703]|nr:hypothetical protein LPJ73_006373 [Coemansia sp. RSA 2703]
MGSSSKESGSKSKRSSKSEKSTKKEKSVKDKAEKVDKKDKKDRSDKKDKSKKKEKEKKRKDEDKKNSKESKRRSSISSISADDTASEAELTDSASDSESESGSESEIDRLEGQRKAAELLVRNIETGLEDYVATNLDMVQYRELNTEETADQRVQKKFKEIYMDYVATGFGADLDLLRKESEIDDDGLEMLIDVLETGTLSFMPADQKMIVDELP